MALGFVVPIPTRPVGVWKRIEFPKVLVSVQIGMVLTVPDPPTCAEAKDVATHTTAARQMWIFFMIDPRQE